MTYRRFRAWLQNGPQLVRFDQGKADLAFAEPMTPDTDPLGLPNLDELTPPPRTAARLPPAATAAPPVQAFK